MCHIPGSPWWHALWGHSHNGMRSSGLMGGWLGLMQCVVLMSQGDVPEAAVSCDLVICYAIYAVYQQCKRVFDVSSCLCPICGMGLIRTLDCSGSNTTKPIQHGSMICWTCPCLYRGMLLNGYASVKLFSTKTTHSCHADNALPPPPYSHHFIGTGRWWDAGRCSAYPQSRRR